MMDMEFGYESNLPALIAAQFAAEFALILLGYEGFQIEISKKIPIL